ncbi:invasion associated locus B family protein [Algicella marina]|uniref:invasion associated locus B family protein n=1 Tax=Algicella marina TaxID=2683284 RepID=UPI001379441F|nr:invasion associated locus B family protein [Algicella marina]
MHPFRILPFATALLLASTSLPALSQDTGTDANSTDADVEVPAPVETESVAEEAIESEGPSTLTTEEPAEPAAETPEPATTTAEPATVEPASEEPAAEETAAEEPATDVAADPAPEAPAEPEIETEVFGDWEKRCAVATNQCFIYQIARDEAGNAVAEVTIVSLPDGDQAEAGATIVTPLGTLLPSGLVMQVDSGQARKYEYSWCTRSGCFARFGLEAGYIANLKAGNKAIMQLSSVAAPERPIRLNLSLSGFTAAYEALPSPE